MSENVPIISPEIIPFPQHWPNATIGIPNAMLRSALFGVYAVGKDKKLFRSEIATQSGVKMFYQGQQLSQADLDVWLLLTKMSKEQGGMGSKFSFHPNAMLKELGKKVGGSNRISLIESIDRLTSGFIVMKSDRWRFKGHLVESSLTLIDEKTASEEDKKKQFIRINPELRDLFMAGEMVRIEIADRNKLSGQLSKWLYCFYITHDNPFPMKVETIKTLSGSQIKDNYEFIRKLKKSFSELEAKLNWTFSIGEDGLIKVRHPRKLFVIENEVKPVEPAPQPRPQKSLSWQEQQVAAARKQRARVAL